MRHYTEYLDTPGIPEYVKDDLRNLEAIRAIMEDLDPSCVSPWNHVGLEGAISYIEKLLEAAHRDAESCYTMLRNFDLLETPRPSWVRVETFLKDGES